MSIDDARRTEFGDFLRSRREKLDPALVGVTTGRRRRTPGLRREEVAERAGIGVDWYVRLEQGRAVSPSTTTLDALARALCLDDTEHAHLRSLARVAERRAFTRESVAPAIRRLVEQLPNPAYVTGRRWDLLAWNKAAAEIFTNFDLLPACARNILLFVLTDPGAKRLFGPAWRAEAQRMVAQFRSTHDLWAGDPAFLDLLNRLRQGCPDFSAWWEAHDIRDSGLGRKLLHHPVRGPLLFDYATFQANDDKALKLAIYIPA